MNSVYGSIYLLVNRVNGKSYIGQTVLSKEHKIREYRSHARGSKRGGDRPIISALKKHGMDLFDLSFIDNALSQEELDKKERHYIGLYDTMNRLKGYNVESGGRRGKLISQETKRQISQTMSKRYESGEMVPPMLGRKQSEKVRLKMSESRKNSVSYPSTHIANGHREGSAVTAETRAKQSSVRKGWCSNPKCYRPILCVELNQVFETIRAAVIALNLPHKANTNIISAAKGRIKSAYGYTWRYMSESPWENKSVIAEESLKGEL